MWGIMTSLKHCGDLYFLLGILVEHFSFSIVWSKQKKLPWGRRGSVAFILNTLQKAQRKACLGNASEYLQAEAAASVIQRDALQSQ